MQIIFGTLFLLFFGIFFILYSFFFQQKKIQSSEFALLSKNFEEKIRENHHLLAQIEKMNQQSIGMAHANREKIQSLFAQHARLLIENIDKNSQKNRTEMGESSDRFQRSMHQMMDLFAKSHHQKIDKIQENQEKLCNKTEKQLHQMRGLVEEKLEKRLGATFELVYEKLGEMQRGLGEMRQLASHVSDLKKVLQPIKTRGILGEIQLGTLLEEVLTPGQYGTNVAVKPGSLVHVEYALALPGKREGGHPLYLPMDAKFPMAPYERIRTAEAKNDAKLLEEGRKELQRTIKKFAKQMAEKYIAPPYTTDFALMFLPTEGLFSEVVRCPDLLAFLQRNHKVVVAGPTTLFAMLNSFQMGFKTLSIQKRSSQVWELLSVVKGEFSKFGLVLEKAQNKLNEANKQIEELVQKRTKIMLKKLQKVEDHPTLEAISPEQSSKKKEV